MEEDGIWPYGPLFAHYFAGWIPSRAGKGTFPGGRICNGSTSSNSL